MKEGEAERKETEEEECGGGRGWARKQKSRVETQNRISFVDGVLW